jgi:hypothetical protein
MNLGFALYNVVGLTLAAFGFLPPILAAPRNRCLIWVSWATHRGYSNADECGEVKPAAYLYTIFNFASLMLQVEWLYCPM